MLRVNPSLAFTDLFNLSYACVDISKIQVNLFNLPHLTFYMPYLAFHSPKVIFLSLKLTFYYLFQVCEYKIVQEEVGSPEPAPFPPCAYQNWGPGAAFFK